MKGVVGEEESERPEIGPVAFPPRHPSKLSWVMANDPKVPR